MKVVVALRMLEADCQLLICQRNKHQLLPLKWEFPGGKIEPGEEARQALQRELDDELGIDATIGPEMARIRHMYQNGNMVDLRFYLVQEYRRSEEHTSELQSLRHLVCRLLLEKKNNIKKTININIRPLKIDTIRSYT